MRKLLIILLFVPLLSDGQQDFLNISLKNPFGSIFY